jgi:hypothetical protein
MKSWEKKDREKRLQKAREAYEADGLLYMATLDAPPHPHTALGLAVGQERYSAMEAVLSMQAHAESLGADGVLGVSICAYPAPYMHANGYYVAYGTAVKWAQSE